MSEKIDLKIGHVTPVEWRPAAIDAFNAIEVQRLRADEWKAIAGRLEKATRCPCCDHGGFGCDDCCNTLNDFESLLAKEKGAG